MPAWTCPQCDRRFARAGQSHECAPAMSLDEYIATAPTFEPPIVAAVLAALAPIGPIHIEPVSVGVFLKRARTFAELRPLLRWETLSFSLTRQVRHPTITRKVMPYGSRYFHIARLDTANDLDDRLVDWLTEAYFDTPA